MRAYALVKGKPEEVDVAKPPKQGVVWIRSVSPSEEEIARLVGISDIPREELQESVEEDERPRLSKKRYIELIYDAPHALREGLQTREIHFYLVGNLVITIESESGRVLDRLEEKCRSGHGRSFFRSSGQFLYRVLDEINDDFLTRLERVGRSLDAIRRRELTEVDIDRLGETSIIFAYFNQAIIANLEVLSQLRKCHHKVFKESDLESFNELYLDKLQVLDTEKVQRELVMHMMNIQSIRSAERLNQTSRRLTALALLIMVPTLITGMYGMNIPLPFQEHPHSFGIIMGGTVLVSVALLFLMHRLEWV